MSKISFEIVPSHYVNLPQITTIWEQVHVFVDGVNILDKENDFHWGIEPSKFLAQQSILSGGRFLFGICGCTADGCDDLVADICVSETQVCWKVYHKTGGGPNAIKPVTYVFDKDQYISAIADFSSPSSNGSPPKSS